MSVYSGPAHGEVQTSVSSEQADDHGFPRAGHKHYLALSGTSLRLAIGLAAGLCFVYDVSGVQVSVGILMADMMQSIRLRTGRYRWSVHQPNVGGDVPEVLSAADCGSGGGDVEVCRAGQAMLRTFLSGVGGGYIG